MLTSDNVVSHAMSRLIVNQFIAIGSRYGTTSYRISSNMLRLKVWDSFALAVIDSIEAQVKVSDNTVAGN